MLRAPNRFFAKLGQLISHRLHTTLPRCRCCQMDTGADHLQISTKKIESKMRPLGAGRVPDRTLIKNDACTSSAGITYND
jgi:hypothetical protein